jgi:hypothetical protein
LQGLNLLARLLGRQPIPLSYLPGSSSATHHNFTTIVKDKNLVPAWADNGVDPSQHGGYYMYHLQYQYVLPTRYSSFKINTDLSQTA